MIRHTVLLTFDGVDDATIQTVIDELSNLPGQIPEIVNYTVGRDLGLSDGGADVVIAADFASVADYQTYSSHPTHVAVLDNHIRPRVTALTRAQIELP